MEYTIENQYLKATVTTFGAQLKSVVRKEDGVEHMWQADKSVWGYHAPILFPYAGKLTEGIMECKGRTYAGGQHGFARLMEHSFVEQTEDTIVLELTDSPETYAKWPYRFRLVSTFRLEGDTVHHTLTVENREEGKLHFGIGYHPAYAVPFDENHQATDYELRFDKLESPLCLSTQPTGLINGHCYYLDKNITSIPIDQHLFANDSHCMVNLNSATLGIYEKDSTRGVVCKIEGFPYTLIWSKTGMPQFVCIEPWHSIPSPENGSTAWEDKPAAAILNPGESWSTTLSTSFVR